ncbi:MYND finger protein [Rhizoctonia solani AG-3 Rhs1AP]|uniref:MYND finger protein n=2 Tax=Rhizoctonia solani AG-3 TaxID=1086053 RepID=A0A074RJG2_9AGAM|nr:MYND finger protein [Rhizoctonia solani AG-3 Rhs1AP]KEP46954.1 MYND finger protein [Rhizoctonia solani 123E]
MSHPFYWLPKPFFYPIGNTPATSLTHDLSPEQPADILSLGCGDPRNILFTLYSDLTVGDVPRELDITCCDIEPAILARNILMFSLLEDGDETTECIWDIFYHFKIDDDTGRVIERQSQKLYDSAQNIHSWRHSRHGSFLKMVDTKTLAGLRLYWSCYANYSGLPPDRKDSLFKEQIELSKSIAVKDNVTTAPSRSAGMAWLHALLPVSELFRSYWETGTTYTQAGDISRAKNLNPTFLYYRYGETFNPHYASFPEGFHLMPAFAPIAEDPVGLLPQTGPGAIIKSKQQFKAWCASFHSSRAANTLTIRFYCGDALSFCHALNSFRLTGNPSTTFPTSIHKASNIILDELSASIPTAPLLFDVIDTSNLTDHVGLLNLLIVAPPLLKQDPLSQSVLYTETLLPSGEDASKSFLNLICSDVPTIAALFGIAPRPYVSGFTAQSNVHHLYFDKLWTTSFGTQSSPEPQHERIVWTNPILGDAPSSCSSMIISFEAESLARILYGIYDKMFSHERTATWMSPSQTDLMYMTANYSRESVAYMFQAVQRRVHLYGGTWDEVASQFIQMGIAENSRMMETNNYQEICLQLHLRGILTAGTLLPEWATNTRVSPRSNVFEGWGNIPPVVCLVLTVPRRRLQVFYGEAKSAGSPSMQCCLWVDGSHENIFAAIHAVWGRCVKSTSSDRIVMEEHPRGTRGPCDLVVSFWVSARILEFPRTVVDLRLKMTAPTIRAYTEKLGANLQVFSTSIEDKHHVRILPYRPTLASEPLQHPPSSKDLPLPMGDHSHLCKAIVTGPTGRNVDSLSIRFEVDSPEEQETLLKGAPILAKQVSACTMELKIGEYKHPILYPYPIQGNSPKLRIARKSHYIEIIVPVSTPLDRAGYFLKPFPVLGANAYTPWNIHHLNLERLPILDTRGPAKVDWLNPLCALQFSDSEKYIRTEDDSQMHQAANALLNFKDTIHSTTLHYSGDFEPHTRTIGLCDNDQGGLHTVLLISGIRLDLASMTITLDAAVFPLTKRWAELRRVHEFRPDVIFGLNTVGREAVAWKRALPAFVERCRNWAHKPTCEYRSRGRIPLSIAFEDNPLCSCGEGVGFTGSQWNVPKWQPWLPFATRAAISPIFSVPYIESVTGGMSGVAPVEVVEACWACACAGKPILSACSKCKKAKYCSSDCQKEDWNTHRKVCKTL